MAQPLRMAEPLETAPLPEEIRERLAGARDRASKLFFDQ
jgi:hypothetical protein